MSIISNKIGTLEYLTAENISVPHCFTTRLGGVSTGHLESLNIGLHRGDALENLRENYRRLGTVLGFSEASLVMTRQTHSNTVRVVNTSDAGKGFDYQAYPECDALVTNSSGLALVVFTADCTPILLHDPETGAVGAVHAGWRGTAGGIAGKAVETMVRRFGCRPENIHAAIGPNIAQCCFETDADVPRAMLNALGNAAQDHIRRSGDKYYVNLKELNALHLKNAGVTTVEISSHCTACQPDRFWSHRVTNGLRGSQGAIIVCKEGKP